jgi:hypothetical protein
MKLSWTHAVFVLASAGCAGAQAWAHYDLNPSHAAISHTVLAFCASIVTSFGLISGSVLVPQPGTGPVNAPANKLP